MHVAGPPDEILYAVNHGNWEPYVGAPESQSLRWKAHQAGRTIIILPEEDLLKPPPIHLTPQENKVLQLLAGGYTPPIAILILPNARPPVYEPLRDKARTLMHMLAKAAALIWRAPLDDNLD